MRQTTLFGTPPNQAKHQSNSNSNQNSRKNQRKSLDQKDSPRVALSDYFKNSVNLNCSPENHEKTNINICKSPITCITDEINVVSIESHPNELADNQVRCDAELTEQVKTKIISNQITSHFLPKKVLNFETESNTNDKICEDEQSLLKNKPKNRQKVEFINGDILNIEKFSTVLMLTEFFSDFSDVLEQNAKDTHKPPKFHSFYDAMQTSQAHLNFKVLAPLLVRTVIFLFSEPLPYFTKNLKDVPVSEMNISAILRLYFELKNRNKELKVLDKDIFCVTFEEKISIFCLLVEELLSLSEFRTFYDERVSNVDSLKRNLKLLYNDLNNFQREQIALKLYRTEKNQIQALDRPNDENDFDKENINLNISNQQSTNEDIDTRLQRVVLCINNTQRDINKLKNKIEKYQNICGSRKRIGTDSYGRNYYRLSSYSDKVILVEIDDHIQSFLPIKTKDKDDKLQNENNTIDNIVGDIQNCSIISIEKSVENDGKNGTSENVTIISQSNLSPNDANIIWMEFSKEEELRHLVRFLKADSCGKKFYQEVISLLKNDSQSQVGETTEDAREIQTRILRSSLKNNGKRDIQFTLKEFAQQLLDFADDLFTSSLLSTEMNYTEWSEPLITEEEVLNISFEDMINILMKLISHLHLSCTSNLEMELISTVYISYSTPTLSQLFLLLEFLENNIDRTLSCLELTCKKCYRRVCWDGLKYTPLIQCVKCCRAYHLTCQQPPLQDIRVGWECNRCDNPNSFTANSFYKSRNEISDDEDSSETELANERKKSLRHKKVSLPTTNEYYSSPEVKTKREKKRRCNTLSSESDDQSPQNTKKGFHAFAFQDVQKKFRPKPNEYTSKLRSSCF